VLYLQGKPQKNRKEQIERERLILLNKKENIISITVDASFFLNSPPFTVYLFPEFSTFP
jgi:hypothetical protein